MPQIKILDENTINKIAAGEVVEKPMAVVKELVENSIDSGASAITIEIRDGGISFIRITDNGCGISFEDIHNAFERHATSKITGINDLFELDTLGFRGEALASISAVAQVECVTKTAKQTTGVCYTINGGLNESVKEIGCPNGTTFIVRNLFYNVPARKKFLKTATTEAGYITDLVTKLALSHPEISFNYILNGKSRLCTKGNGKLIDCIYSIYGRDIVSDIIEFTIDTDVIKGYGYIGKPVVSRGSRAFMNCFVNGRYVKNNVLFRAIEEGFAGYRMTQRFPFAVLLFDINPSQMDVNVHPSKMEIRFTEADKIYSLLCNSIKNAIRNADTIPQVKLDDKKIIEDKPLIHESGVKTITKIPEPFESKRSTYADMIPSATQNVFREKPLYEPKQQSLFDQTTMQNENKKNYRVVGCVFATYWIVEYNDEMYIMDQHAAHEKILYEKFKKSIENHSVISQPVSPPFVITLTADEENIVNTYKEVFYNAGFEIEHFGGSEFTVSSVPSELFGLCSEKSITDTILMLTEEKELLSSDSSFADKVASLACKAAVKGGRRISEYEAYELVNTLFTLDNPFNCPHGRPTMIKMTKNQLEKQFGRIV